MHGIALLVRAEEMRRKRLSPEELAKVEAEDRALNSLQWKVLLLAIPITIGAFYLHPLAGFISVAFSMYNAKMIPLYVVHFKLTLGTAIKRAICINALLVSIILALLLFAGLL
jgi:hypothetical protein